MTTFKSDLEHRVNLIHGSVKKLQELMTAHAGELTEEYTNKVFTFLFNVVVAAQIKVDAAREHAAAAVDAFSLDKDVVPLASVPAVERHTPTPAAAVGPRRIRGPKVYDPAKAIAVAAVEDGAGFVEE